MNNADRPRILVIDDEDLARELYKYQLENLGYEVLDSATGNDGLDLLRKSTGVDIVITDLSLPDIHGSEVTTIIKKEWPHIEIITITAYSSVSAAIEVIRAGAYDYLEKPFDIDELNIMLQRCLQKIESDGLIAQLSGRIFLSYARENKEEAKQVYQKLQAAGFNPWMDLFDISPGEIWEFSINKAIRESTFFFALLSHASVNKRGMIQKEIKVALEVRDQLLDSDIYLIPIRLEECSVPAPLDRFQWVDLFYSNGWEKLIAGIRDGLRRRT